MHVRGCMGAGGILFMQWGAWCEKLYRFKSIALACGVCTVRKNGVGKGRFLVEQPGSLDVWMGLVSKLTLGDLTVDLVPRTSPPPPVESTD